MVGTSSVTAAAARRGAATSGGRADAAATRPPPRDGRTNAPTAGAAAGTNAGAAGNIGGVMVTMMEGRPMEGGGGGTGGIQSEDGRQGPGSANTNGTCTWRKEKRRGAAAFGGSARPCHARRAARCGRGRGADPRARTPDAAAAAAASAVGGRTGTLRWRGAGRACLPARDRVNAVRPRPHHPPPPANARDGEGRERAPPRSAAAGAIAAAKGGRPSAAPRPQRADHDGRDQQKHVICLFLCSFEHRPTFFLVW